MIVYDDDVHVALLDTQSDTDMKVTGLTFMSTLAINSFANKREQS